MILLFLITLFQHRAFDFQTKITFQLNLVYKIYIFVTSISNYSPYFLGYIYHLPGHIRKPGRGLGVQRIATCPFTSAVGKITLESPTMMHAFTLTGLETYTLKTGHR